MAEQRDFPLLTGNPDPCLTEDGRRYPLTVELRGERVPLFVRGVVTAAELSRVARQAAERIADRFAGQRLLLVEVLEGGRVFIDMLGQELATLGKEAGLRWEAASLKVRSYGHGSHAAGLRILAPLADRQGREITDCGRFDALLLVDDLIDAGLTMHGLVTDYLPRLGAREVAICTMLDKQRPRRPEVTAELEKRLLFSGLVVPNLWLVGYGLDLALPGGHGFAGLNLFRQALPGGVYAFNTAIENRLLAAYQHDPEGIRQQLSAYVSQG